MTNSIIHKQSIKPEITREINNWGLIKVFKKSIGSRQILDSNGLMVKILILILLSFVIQLKISSF